MFQVKQNEMLFTLQLSQHTKENTQQCLWMPYLWVPRGIRQPLVIRRPKSCSLAVGIFALATVIPREVWAPALPSMPMSALPVGSSHLCTAPSVPAPTLWLHTLKPCLGNGIYRSPREQELAQPLLLVQPNYDVLTTMVGPTWPSKTKPMAERDEAMSRPPLPWPCHASLTVLLWEHSGGCCVSPEDTHRSEGHH